VSPDVCDSNSRLGRIRRNSRRHAERYASRVGNPFAFLRKFSVKNCVNSAENAKNKKRPRAGRFHGSEK
jgi:hypothetical protein